MEKLPHLDAKKSLGQHFLNSPRVPKLMSDAVEIGKNDTVLEIGPGTGMLTRELLSRGARVIAIEADGRAVMSLSLTFKDALREKQLTLVHQDIRTIDLKALGLRPSAYKVVANIPYYLSGMLFRLFLEHDIHPSSIVFLVQREVAERIARDRKESILSLSVKVFGEPRYIKTIPRGNFTPQPNIDSAIIAITDISKERLGKVPVRFFFDVLHHGFKSKRKQLIGNLSAIHSREELTHIFSTLELSVNIRGEDMHLDAWLKLCEALLAPR
jgi:16S rRNA (adenine1518-N6/adenine1519-N6)-dimethyltransferase